MLPAAAAGRGGRRLRTARLTPEGAALLGTPAEPSEGSPEGSPDATLPVLGRDDRRILTLLAVSGGPVPLVRIRSELDLSPHRGFARLEREGLVTLAAERVASPVAGRPPSPSAADDPETPPALTPAQQFAARQRGRRRRRDAASRPSSSTASPAAARPRSISGASPTVWPPAAPRCCSSPRSRWPARAEELLRRRFGPDLAVFHSGLTRKEPPARRSGAFAPARRGSSSAPAPPCSPPSTIWASWSSTKSTTAPTSRKKRPRYHARQGRLAPRPRHRRHPAAGLGDPLARIRRGRRFGPADPAAASLPGSAAAGSPRWASWTCARTLRAHREDPARRGPLVLSPPLAEALREAVDAGRQALVLLNRRGYGGRLACLRCGEIVACDPLPAWP